MAYLLQPQFVDKIWGGNYFEKNFAYQTSASCGEVWGISGGSKFLNIDQNGLFRGRTLNEVYQSNKELFGNHKSKEFPILVKLIEAKHDLSIQVHPNNQYASKHHNSLGKTESWFILDAKKDATVIIGHNATSQDELQSLIVTKQYEKLLKRFSIKTGDLFDIPAGTIHAICSGTVLLEVQQASDITYRLYDYDRLEDGKPRTLHQEQVMDVIDVPSQPLTHTGNTKYFLFQIDDVEEDSCVADIYGDYYVILEGQGTLDNLAVKKGDFVFVPSKQRYHIKGKLKIARIWIKEVIE